MDGWVVIGTKLDTKQLEADLKNAKKELTQFQKEEERLLKEKGKIELSLSAYDDEKAKIKANTDEMLKKAETEGQVTNLLNMENMELDKLTQKYSKQFSSLESINDKLKNNQLQQGLINNNIDEANRKLEQAKGYENVSNHLGKIKDKTSDVVKQVGRWALAVFSVRSAYSFMTKASSTLAQYNKEYGANLEYIRFALAQAIAPVLQFLVNLAYKLLVYINYIAQAWFGVNLFSNASAKNFQKMAGSAASIKKSLQTAGFDEMNVLSDTSSSGGGAGIPSLDLAKPEDVPIPSWLKWIVENKDLIIAVLAGIAAGLVAINLGLGIMTSLGIGILVAGIVMIIQDLIALINDPTWQNFLNFLGSVAVAIGGLMVIMGNWWGLLVAIVGLAVKLVVDNWETVKKVLITVGGWVWNNVIMPVWNFIKALFDTILSIIQTAFSVIYGIFTALVGIMKNPFEVLKLTVETVISGARKIITGFGQLFKGIFTGDMKMALEGFKNIFKGIFESLWGIAKYPLNLIIGGINSLIDGANRIQFDVPSWVPGLGGQKWGFNISKIPMLRTGAIINNPSYGVPVGGGRALAGEAGAEGIIPLTDSQAMETLGEAIGRYITINANIVNSMNGRTISRELQRIRGTQDFAYNK